MKQADLGLNPLTKRTRQREFLEQMERVVPWAALVELVAPNAPEGRRGRPPFPVETMLRIHFMQQWFTLSDPAMEEALHDVPLFREFAGLDHWQTRLPNETTILRFRHLLEHHRLAEQMLHLVNELLRDKGLMLRAGTVVDANADLGTELDEERLGRARPGDAPVEEGPAVVLRDKGPYRLCHRCAGRLPDTRRMAPPSPAPARRGTGGRRLAGGAEDGLQAGDLPAGAPIRPRRASQQRW